MSFLGKLVNGAAQITTGLGGVAIKATGSIVDEIGNAISPNNSLTSGIKKATTSISNSMLDNCDTVGLLTGDVISSTMIEVAAGGVASTGTAISSLHGIAASNAALASLGGGAISAGGGGIACGEAIIHGTMAATTLAGGVSSVPKNK